MLQYSGWLRLDRMTSEPTNEQYADASFDIDFSLLHNVILLEVKAYVMKYEAMKKRKAKENIDNLESQIDRLQNSSDENDRKRVDNLKKELQGVEDEQESALEDTLHRTTWKAKDQCGSFVQ